MLSGSTDRVVAHLRLLSANAMDEWPPETFLDYVVNRALDQSIGGFQDAWDPTDLLQQCGFECLVGCDNVQAFGDVQNGKPGDAAIRVARTEAQRGGGARVESIHIVEQGHNRLAALRYMVKDELTQLGDRHWGDQTDVRNLTEALDVGVLMMCNGLQNGGRDCLYNIGSTREDYAYWIALWWCEPTHFRLAQVSYHPNAERALKDLHAVEYTCFWKDAELPTRLRDQYRACNRLAN
jgi:hypothetical protein